MCHVWPPEWLSRGLRGRNLVYCPNRTKFVLVDIFWHIIRWICLVLRLGMKYAIFGGRKVPCLAPKIWGQLFQGFWQSLSDFDETWCAGAYWTYLNVGQLKLPGFCHLDPKFSPKSFSRDERGMNFTYWPNLLIFGLVRPFWRWIRLG